ncbi:hypothetical protein BS50DRAFT_586102 [Corynespora cassiicola Philippines]|uniref:Uncharacterized protein n=1 Tax=Corynespora cassiicola Philippines TaxID=1448308 RepID=A0A2T2NT98_CORCC|nr:hypothetical protein BS50DRAFT_586102 [Corynespora cassiicola Philippines]
MPGSNRTHPRHTNRELLNPIPEGQETSTMEVLNLNQAFQEFNGDHIHSRSAYEDQAFDPHIYQIQVRQRELPPKSYVLMKTSWKFPAARPKVWQGKPQQVFTDNSRAHAEISGVISRAESLGQNPTRPVAKKSNGTGHTTGVQTWEWQGDNVPVQTLWWIEEVHANESERWYLQEKEDKERRVAST